MRLKNESNVVISWTLGKFGLNIFYTPGTVAQTCNPSTLEVEAEGSTTSRQSEPYFRTLTKICYNKITMVVSYNFAWAFTIHYGLNRRMKTLMNSVRSQLATWLKHL